jgi:hypothetical protein
MIAHSKFSATRENMFSILMTLKDMLVNSSFIDKYYKYFK